MKIIEALKKVKDLKRKADDIKAKIKDHCADLDCESPVYPDQRRQVAEWLQSHNDIVKEILSLRVGIQRTNILTNVTIELGGVQVTKTIAEWIHRRKDLAQEQQSCWNMLTDRGLHAENKIKLTPTSPDQIIRIRRYYDPAERDRMLELYRSEPSLIDGTLEIVNAVTDLK